MSHGVILGQSIPDLNNNYLALDGSNSMTGRLNANGGIEIPSTTEIRMPYNTSDELKMFLDSQIPTIKSSDNLNIEAIGVLNLVINNVVKLLASSNGLTMYDQLNMGSNKITNLANGIADTDAATVGQLNDAIANAGPQYAKPTGNRHFDFCSLFVILQSNISSSTPIDPGESNCFTAAYKYIYRSPSIGDEMLLVRSSGSSSFNIVYTSSGWEMSSIDKASMGQVYFIAGRVV